MSLYLSLPACVAALAFPARLYSIASTASERLLFSLGAGTLLAAVVWLLLRVFPKKDSRTSFAVWFATLMITAVLPVASFYLSYAKGTAGRSSGAVVTVSANWAVYIFLAWFSLAGIGLARVAVALLQVRKLRRGSARLKTESLDPQLRELVEEFRNAREVELLVSSKQEIPTAIGFLKPAILLPQWLLEETPAEELKYILLHELAHLRRRDDWTNLAQQVVKALLFFVPSIWWIERRLALDREMACDDAVLAHSGRPHLYAECLARVAERSFVRRQMALAQAAVSKLRQLTMRVTRILDPNRQQPTRMWKPAIPALVVVAGLCMFSASQGPMLVGFSDAQSGAASEASLAHGTAVNLKAPRLPLASHSTNDGQLRIVPAGLKISAVERRSNVRAWNAGLKTKNSVGPKPHVHRRELYTLTNLHAQNKIPRGPAMLARSQMPQPNYVTVREELVIMVSQNGSAAPEAWQLRVVQISVMQAQPKKPAAKKI